MPRRHGRKGAFWLADSGGVSREISASGGLSSVEMPRTIDSPQVTALNEDDHVYVPGVRGGTIRIVGFPSEDANAMEDVMTGIMGGVGGTAASAFKWFPGGSVAGRIVYSGSVYVTNYSPSGGVGNALQATGEFVIHGSVTRGTV